MWAYSAQHTRWGRDLPGYLASALVLATFCQTSMVRLRWIAITSNCAFIYYALRLDLRPILLLHCILLPVNIWRLAQLRRQHIEPAPAVRGSPVITRFPARSWMGRGGQPRHARPSIPLDEGPYDSGEDQYRAVSPPVGD